MDAPLDLLVLPGLAFDPSGGRLGRGGGYYDKYVTRLLARCAERGWPAPALVALAYRAQMVAAVPMEGHDRPVDAVVTAAGVHGDDG